MQVVTGDRQAGKRGPSLEVSEKWSQLEEICQYKVQISAKVLHPLNVCLHTNGKHYISNTNFKAGAQDGASESHLLQMGLGFLLHCQSISKALYASIAGCM